MKDEIILQQFHSLAVNGSEFSKAHDAGVFSVTSQIIAKGHFVPSRLGAILLAKTDNSFVAQEELDSAQEKLRHRGISSVDAEEYISGVMRAESGLKGYVDPKS